MQSLLHQSDIYSEILNTVSCGVLVTDSTLKIVFFNRAAEQITGWTAERAIGKKCFEVITTALGEGTCPLESSLMTGKSLGPMVIHLVDQQDRKVPVKMIANVLRNEKGEIVGAVQSFGDMSTIHALRKKLEHQYDYYDIISRNHQMQQLFAILPKFAESSSTVLIRGESGTGKELFARAIHNLSPRRESPFVAVNCAALPDTLLESELFGHVKGAFTDARQDREGRIAAAEGGTLLLDEIGDLSSPIQVKLLRFLQDHTYEPLGSSQTRQADVRVIAATHRNLEHLIEQESFRSDFYYRLNVLTLEIPPLRDRLEDIPLLVDHILDNWMKVNDKTVLPPTPGAMRALMLYRYTGNVRELENILERAAVIADHEAIDIHHLPSSVVESLSVPRMDTTEKGKSESTRVELLTPIERAERDAIRSAMREHGGKKLHVAEALGFSRATLWRKLKKYGLS